MSLTQHVVMQENEKMGQVVYLGLCLLGCLLLNPAVEGAGSDKAVAEFSCPPGSYDFRNICYVYFPNAIPWSSAEAECQKLGGGAHLASLHDSQEERALSAHLKSQECGQVWIGLSAVSTGQELRWEWSSGLPYNPRLLPWSDWAPDASLPCGALSPSDSPRWSQLDCSVPLPYVCKYKAS